MAGSFNDLQRAPGDALVKKRRVFRGSHAVYRPDDDEGWDFNSAHPLDLIERVACGVVCASGALSDHEVPSPDELTQMIRTAGRDRKVHEFVDTIRPTLVDHVEDRLADAQACAAADEDQSRDVRWVCQRPLECDRRA